MEDKHKLKIEKVTFVPIKKEGKAKYRVDINFDGFWLAGFKYILDEETHKHYLTPPSYFSPSGWRKMFKTDNSSDWVEITNKVEKEFETYSKNQADENQDFEDIPF